MNGPFAGSAGRGDAAVGERKRIVLGEIRERWGKFSPEELSALVDKDDLVTRLAVKYNLDRKQADRDVDTLLKGRAF